MSKCPRTETVQGGRHRVRVHVPDKQWGEVLDSRQQSVVDVAERVTIRKTAPVQYEV